MERHFNRQYQQQFISQRNNAAVHVETREVNGVVVPVISRQIRKFLEEAEGDIPYSLTNDRAFRGIVSYSERVRKGLAAILLDKKESEIFSAEILNPISFGSRFDEKKTEEDVQMLINGRFMLDIEMQNIYLEVNMKRFLLYLCRNFNSIGMGNDYNKLKPNVLVGILNYPFAKDEPEFYAEYRLINKKTGKPLFEEDSFFGFNVLDLGNSSLATQQDHTSGRSLLAALCRATTWEELRKLGEQSEFAEEVAEVMYATNADEREWFAMDEARRYVEVQTTISNERKRIASQLDTTRQQLGDTEKKLGETKQELDETRQLLDHSEKEKMALQDRIAELETQLRKQTSGEDKRS